MGAALLAPPVGAWQQGTPSLTTDDVVRQPDSTTNVNVAAGEAARERAEADAAAKAAVANSAASAGYAKVDTASGYTFERPDAWKRVENLESAGAPSFFKYDAVFQDPTSGAVISAVSVDRSQLESPIDIGDTASVNTLLSTMLNPANVRDGVKIYRQVTGETQNGNRWLRIKAQGNGQSTDGTVVDTTFWVQLVQSDTRLALVAVGFPTAQQGAVAQAAFHTVRTLEIQNVAGSAPTDGETNGSGAATTPRKKNSAGGVRKQ